MSRARTEEQNRQKSFTRRALLLGSAKAALLSVLGARLYYLQVVDAERYRLLAEDNRISMRLSAPRRGRIVDRNGIPLAVNRQNYQVHMVAEQAQDVDRTLDALTHIIHLDSEDRARVKRDISARRSFVPVRVKDNLSWDQVSRIAVNSVELPGVFVEAGQSRHYPYGPTLAHIVGYVGAVSEQDLTGDPVLELPGFRIGKNGVEKVHDEELRGRAGNTQVEVNAVGRVMQQISRVEGQSGHDVELTLDMGLQNYAHQRLIGERSASAIVMDAITGDVLSLVSVPSYDPSAFTRGLSSAEWHSLIEDPLSPLSNKAISGQYAPGSTFKMVVSLAAMENHIGPQEEVYCPGHMDLGNHRFHCWRRGGHGRMNMRDALKQSCDVYFYEMAKRLGIDAIAAMARRMGFGQTVGIDLPSERTGLMPTEDWKLANIGERWQGGETLIQAIGQGYMLATPLQLAVMTARLVNGGKAIRPHVTRRIKGLENITEEVKEESPDLGLMPLQVNSILDAMDAVCNEQRGTAYSARIHLPGWEMGGKTGTSQVRRITASERAAGIVRNEDLPWRRRDHALFVGYAPVHNPRYVCSVVVEHGGGGGSVAAPIARDLLIETQRRDPMDAMPPSPLAGLKE